MATHTEKPDDHGGSHKTESSHATETHHESSHDAHSVGRKRWYQKVLEKMPHPTSADFGAHPLLDKLQWGLLTATTIAWWYSSIYTNALGLATVATWATKKYLLPAFGVNPPSAGGGHGGSGH